MNELEVVWTPPAAGAPEPILKAFESDGVSMRKTCAYHRTADGRRYFRIPDIEENRQLVAERGAAWGLMEDVAREDWETAEANPPPAETPPTDKKSMVMAELRRQGIPHKANMKLETLVNKLPESERGPFL